MMLHTAECWLWKYCVAVLAFVLTVIIGNVSRASVNPLPLSDDGAEIFALKVKIRMGSDEKNCGTVRDVIRVKDLDRQTEQGMMYAYAMTHVNGKHQASVVFHENKNQKLTTIMVVPHDNSKLTYAKAAVPIILYSLLTLDVEQKDIEKLVFRSMAEEIGMVDYKFNGRNIVMYAQKPKGDETITKYFIASL